MKLKKEFEQYTQLYRDGFLFDPVEKVLFYKGKKSDFKAPEGFEEWEQKPIKIDSYLKERLSEMGISKKANKVELIGGINLNKDERVKHDILTVNNRGDIGIMQYSLKRIPYTFMDKGNESSSATNRECYHEQIRLAPWNELILGGKYDFTRAKNVPFWSPGLIDRFEAEKEVDTLIITEGQLKALKACADGLPVVGFTSITHYKSKGTIHQEIIEFIKQKNVQRVVILWDGDCRNISTTDLQNGEDVSSRPYRFYKYASNIRGLLQDFFPAKRLQIFFATINSYELEGTPKGIDDLLIQHADRVEDIKRDFKNIGEMPGVYIYWQNITQDFGLKKLYGWFNLKSITAFYQAHREKIDGKDFIFNGTTYKVEKDEPKIKVSADIKQYKRIGADYYRLMKKPIMIGSNGKKVFEQELSAWKKAEIIQDHGKVIDHIEKFAGFTNIPSHIDYQPIHDGYWNLYYDVKHEARPGKFPHIEMLLKHLFAEQYSMILDYLTILYKKPDQKLPVICLVGKTNKTGKSTFGYLLKLIFKHNMTGISNTDLLGEFNSNWASKLIAISEETLLEKKEAYEKVKNLTTAKYIARRDLFKAAVDLPLHIHFVFFSNHPETFLRISKEDSRLWVRRIEKRPGKIKNFDNSIADEIPYFIHFLQSREVEYEDTGERLYFAPEDFQTNAFHDLVKNSEPGIIKEIRSELHDLFMVTGASEIRMDVKDIKAEFGLRQETNYIKREISEFLGLERAKKPDGSRWVSTYAYQKPNPSNREELITVKGKGEFYIFKRSDFCEVDEMGTVFDPPQSVLDFSDTDQDTQTDDDLPF